MRIAIVSDIHGNRSALDAVVADLGTQAPDLVVHAGDLVGNGASNAEVIDTVRALAWPGVYGNTDEMLWRPERLREISARLPEQRAMWSAIEEIAEFTLEQLSASQLEYLAALPASWSTERLDVLHASPGDAWSSPSLSAPDDQLLMTYGELAGTTVVFGHLHVPFVRHVGNRTIANTGAVSLSHDGDVRASYLLLDDEVAQIRRVAYDVERECRALERVRHPHHEWISAMLRLGRFVSFR
jgi:putative phosphoesterase